MSADLTTDIQQVNGIGEKKAAEILGILEEHGVGRRDPLLEKAIDAAHEGDDRDAAMYLRRYDSAE